MKQTLKQSKQAVVDEFEKMLEMHSIVDEPGTPLAECDERLMGLKRDKNGLLECPECGGSELMLRIDYGLDEAILNLSSMTLTNEKSFKVEGPNVILREIYCTSCDHDILSGSENLKRAAAQAKPKPKPKPKQPLYVDDLLPLAAPAVELVSRVVGLYGNTLRAADLTELKRIRKMETRLEQVLQMLVDPDYEGEE